MEFGVYVLMALTAICSLRCEASAIVQNLIHFIWVYSLESKRQLEIHLSDIYAFGSYFEQRVFR